MTTKKIGRESLPYSEVKSRFEKEGYILLSKIYKTNQDRLKVKCPNGHVTDTTLSRFGAGHRCKICRDNSLKLTIEEAKERIESLGFKLYTKSINSNQDYMDVECSRGHRYSARYTSITKIGKAHNCKKCASIAKQFTIEDVQKVVVEAGYKLHSKKYDRNTKRIDVECSNGHKYNVSYASFKRGQRCARCRSNSEKLTIESVQELARSKGYKLITKEYDTARTKMEFECAKGHRFKVATYVFKKMKFCPICFKENRPRNLNSHDPEFVRKWFSDKGYELLEDHYFSCEESLRVRCPKKHEFRVRFGNVYHNNLSCPICNFRLSTGEVELRDYIKSLYAGEVLSTFQLNNSTKNLDIYIPKLNIGFEFQGTYFHMDPRLYKKEDINKKCRKTALEIWNKDLDKVIICENQGIDLYPIWEWDWTTQKDIEKMRIKLIIQSTNNRLEKVPV